MTRPCSACPRCGSPLLELSSLADLAIGLDRSLTQDLDHRLTVEDRAAAHVLASSLPCHAGCCRRHPVRIDHAHLRSAR